MARDQRWPAHRIARWAAISAVLVIAILLLGATLAVRHYTSAEYLERRLGTELAESTDGVYRIRIGATESSLWSGTLTASRVTVTADTLAVMQKARQRKRPRTGYRFDLPAIRLSGIRLAPLLRGRIVVARVVIDAPDIGLALDRAAPMDGTPDDSVRLPHQSLLAIERPLRIDEIRIDHGRLQYAERAPDGARPGIIRFDDLNAVIRNVTNDRARATTTPATIDLHTKIAGAGQLAARFSYDLAAPRLNLVYQGSIGRMAAASLNTMLPNLEGMRITEGRMDSTWFSFIVEDDLARGRMEVRYRDLKTKLIDKVTHKQGIKEHVKTFVTNHLTLRNDNAPGEGDGPIVVAVRRKRAPDIPLFKFLWHVLRQGLAETLGLKAP